jgi:hypothetical protein
MMLLDFDLEESGMNMSNTFNFVTNFENLGDKIEDEVQE